MKFIDFFFLILVAATAGLSFYLGWFPATIFLTLVFFAILASITLHYLSSPLPRFMLGASFLPVSEDEVEEIHEKRKKE